MRRSNAVHQAFDAARRQLMPHHLTSFTEAAVAAGSADARGGLSRLLGLWGAAGACITFGYNVASPVIDAYSHGSAEEEG